jgi:hypothetical protein
MVAAKLANMPAHRPASESPSIEGVSAETAATMLNVGRASVERAKTVQREAVQEIVTAVEQGAVNGNQRRSCRTRR